MAKTIVGVGDPKAIKKFSAFLAVDVGRKSYFNKKFMGVGEEAQTPLQTLPHLEKDAGDQISYDLVMQLKMKPIQGDQNLRGNEEDLKFYTDGLYIDQLRGGVNTGGKMSRKRTIHDMRKIARVRQSEWWARLFDETLFMYLSGARGINADFIEGSDFTGYAGNAFVAPDALHILYGGQATSKNTVTAADKLSLITIDKAKSRAETMGGGTSGVPEIQPCEIDGEPHFVLVMHPWQEYDLRNDTSSGQWLDIQKAAAGAEGRSSPMFRGGLGMHNNVILHSHKGVVRFSDYGGGSNVSAGRALFLGRQAGVVAFGSPGTGLRFDWHEEMEDRGNQIVITTSSIFGVKKTAFTINGTSRDFGVIAVDTACKDPTT
ncbi:MAG: N4-gp56 family major capsid protein [Gammaproteobacteria bacterium]|nr:N4-gp56 family major capsid protein [Gammaproteobacteria bacterium]